MSDQDVTRRTLLKSGASGSFAAAFATNNAMASESTTQNLDVYRALGIEPIINAAGTITTLGGSLMPPEVIAAWQAAATSFVRLTDLQDRIGERIAKLVDVESALVTTGAAGGIQVGTAAALTYKNRERISQLPLPAEMGLEVIRQKSHRQCYDNQVKSCGVKLVDVETIDDLRRVINNRTAMMLSYNVLESESKISQRDWTAIAREAGVPTLLDAAADTPPVEALSKYNKLGFDMVVFSGGKAIRGPQDAGLLLGRKDLIEAAKLNTAPRCGNIGRGLKVSKEDMVAMWAAVERFVHLDHEAEWKEWERRITVIEDAVRKIPSVKTKRVTPAIANHVPHLVIDWNPDRVKITPDQLKSQLAQGQPSIITARVHGTGSDGFLVSVFMLKPDEASIVAKRIASILTRSTT